MKTSGFQEAVAVGGGDPEVEGVALALDSERDIDPRRPERPERAIEARQRGDGLSRDGAYDVRGVQARPPRRTIARKPDENDALILVLGRIETQPGSGRAVDPADRQQIVQDGFQQIDGDDHIERHDMPVREARPGAR
jgi:hypothetical protein